MADGMNKEVIEFTFYCEKCGRTITTRSDDTTSVKECPKKGCPGRMLYRRSRIIPPKELVSGKPVERGKLPMVPL